MTIWVNWVVTTIIVDVANGDDERMVNALALIIVADSPLVVFYSFYPSY